MESKVCTGCEAKKPATAEHFFREPRGKFGLSARCKDCRKRMRATAGWASETKQAHKEQAAKWRANNIEKARAAGRANYHARREKNLARSVAYYYANKDKVRTYNRRRYHETPAHRVRVCISGYIRKSLRGEKRRSWEALVGYSLERLTRHLERQFVRGMTWGNYGEWHIDHIVPLASFNITKPSDPDFRRAWALTNLRPLWAGRNLSKGARRELLL